MKPFTLDERRDVDGALQFALVQLLKARVPGEESPVQNRIYDRVPEIGATFPYVVVPRLQVVDDGAEGITADEIFVDFSVWSAAVGQMEARAVVGWLRRRLDDVSLDLGKHHALVEFAWRGARDAGSDDPLLTHRIASFVALTETHDD